MQNMYFPSQMRLKTSKNIRMPKRQNLLLSVSKRLLPEFQNFFLQKTAIFIFRVSNNKKIFPPKHKTNNSFPSF